jgi:Tfp pilus assembly protein PilO
MTSKLIEQLAGSPKRVRIMFRIALITLLSVGCYNWTVKPQTGYLQAAGQHDLWSTKLSNQMKQIHSSINDYKKKISDLTAQSEQSQKILFHPDTVREFFCGLEKLAEESGCRIESLTFDNADSRPAEKQSPDTTVQATQTSVIAIGDYGTFIRFFERTSQYPQKISITDMRLEPLTPGQSTLRCHAAITVYVANKTEANNP